MGEILISGLRIPLDVLELAWRWKEKEKPGKDCRCKKKKMAGWLTFIAIPEESQVSSLSQGNMVWVCRAKMCVCPDRCAPRDFLLLELFSSAQMKEPVWTYTHMLWFVNRFHIHLDLNTELDWPSNITAPTVVLPVLSYLLFSEICLGVFYQLLLALFT